MQIVETHPPAPALTPTDRKDLRARAHHLNPVVMIGDAGLTEAVIAEAERALTAHELIKIRVLGDDRDPRQALMQQLCAALACAPVQIIGKLLVVYRPRPPEPAADRGPHVPKKLAAVGKAASNRIRVRKSPATAPAIGAGSRRAPAAGKRTGALDPAPFDPKPAAGWGSAGRAVAAPRDTLARAPRSPAGSGPSRPGAARGRAASPARGAPRPQGRPVTRVTGGRGKKG